MQPGRSERRWPGRVDDYLSTVPPGFVDCVNFVTSAIRTDGITQVGSCEIELVSALETFEAVTPLLAPGDRLPDPSEVHTSGYIVTRRLDGFGQVRQNEAVNSTSTGMISTRPIHIITIIATFDGQGKAW